ncbi:MAG: MarR family transcriptional regulator, partial [Proteobacteria bacterium]|nr:MarR family transcriptional regulator [Pseudomonadota bacterium]
MTHSQKYGKRPDLALSLWVKLARAYGTFARHADRDIERYGLTPPQFAVLEALGHLGRLTLGDLSKKRLVTGGCMTVIVDNLEREGLVERTRSHEDRRVIHVELTPKGGHLFKTVFPPHVDRITELSSVLSEREQHQLSSLLKKLGLKLVEREHR